MRPDAMEALRREALPDGLSEVVALADRLCVARVAAAVRDLRLYGPDAPSPPPRARGAHQAALNLALERKLLRAGPAGAVPTAKLGEAAPYGELLAAEAATVARDPLAFRWLGRALDGLPSVLSGTLLAEEVLFPRGDFSLVEALYADSALFGSFSRLAVRLCRGLGAKRVLEVGAGTGETARRILEGPAVERLLATDVAPALVARARDKLAPDGRAEAALLDIDGPAWPEERFDVVVALNVLHLAKDLPGALSRARSCLLPGGWLIGGEVSAPDPLLAFPLVELSFGLLPSFWGGGLQSPLRRPAEWERELTGAGFGPVHFLPVTVDRAGGGPDHGGVYVARAPFTAGRR